MSLGPQAVTAVRTRDERLVDWATDQAGGERVPVSLAREAWEYHVALELLHRGFLVGEVSRMLGGYLPGDDLPWPERQHRPQEGIS